MWPYFLLVVLIYIIQFGFSGKRKEDLRFYTGILILFLFAAFRGNGSGDYFEYLSRGEYIYTINDIFHNNTHMEIGYAVLYYIVNLLHLPKQCVIMAMNFISIACISKFIYKYSPYKCLSLLLFLPLYFQFDMHAARTAVAISISALSITYAYKRKFLKFCIVIISAMMFHQTAAIAFIIYFLVNVRINLYLGIIWILAGMGFVQLIGVDRLALNIFKVMQLEYFYAKYDRYVNSELYGYKFSLFDPRLWLVIAIFILAKLFCKNAEKLENLFINCCFINIMSLVLLSEHTFICYRLSSFFNIYTIILVPLILNRLCKAECYKSRFTLRSNRIIAKSMVLSLFMIYALIFVLAEYVFKGIEYKLFFV